jgi:hypothetical protein
MRPHPLALCIVVLLAAPSCHRRAHLPPEQLPAAICTRAHHGQTASVIGYLVQPYFSISCTDDCFLWVSPSPDAQEGVYARFAAGAERNQIRPIRSHGELTGGGATRLADKEFHVLDDTGKTLGIGDLVRVTGLVLVTGKGDKLDCRMEVARVEASDGTAPAGSGAPAALAPGGPPVFVDLSSMVMSTSDRRPVVAAVMAALGRAGIAARQINTEVDGFYFDEPLLRGELGEPPPAWWPESLAADWKTGVTSCQAVAAGGDTGSDSVRACSDRLHYALWERWLIDQHAARYVWVSAIRGDGEGHHGRAFGEAFVAGQPGKRTLWREAPGDAQLPALAADIAVRLAHDEGTAEERTVHELPHGAR